MASIKKLGIILIICAIFLFNTYGNASSQNSSEPTGSLSGYVTDTLMSPLEGACIRVCFHETYVENYSNSLGYYHVTNIPLCYCMKNATCSKSGYISEWVLLSIGENTTYDFILTSLGPDPYPILNGTIGNNGYYTCSVNVTFVNVEDIDALFYKVDSGQWVEYTETFPISESGMHLLYWYWTNQGNESEIKTINLRIDYDLPVLQVSSERMGVSRIKIIAEASDVTSGVHRVEFFVDNVSSNIDYTEPYEGIISGIGIHRVTAVAYDNAGNSANSTITTPYSLQGYIPYRGLFLSRLFFLFFFHRLIS